MYRRFGVVPHVRLVIRVFPFSVIFGAFSWDYRGENLEEFFFSFVEGFTHEYLEALF